VFADTLSKIYEERTAKTKEEIIEVPTINKSFSAFTFLLLLSFSDLYSPLSYPYFTTSNTTSSFLVLSSDPSYCHYKHQPDTIAAMSDISDHQAPSSFCDDEGCDCEYQDGRHVPIFGEEAYKVITTLEGTSLQLRHEFSVSTTSNSCQPSHTAIEKLQKNIQKL
jgi:hypothetical protein